MTTSCGRPMIGSYVIVNCFVSFIQVVQHDARQLSSLMKAVVKARMQLVLLRHEREGQASERSAGEASTSAPSASAGAGRTGAGSKRGRGATSKAARDAKQQPPTQKQDTDMVPQLQTMTEALCAADGGEMSVSALIDIYVYTEAALIQDYVGASNEDQLDHRRQKHAEGMAVAALVGEVLDDATAELLAWHAVRGSVLAVHIPAAYLELCLTRDGTPMPSCRLCTEGSEGNTGPSTCSKSCAA